MGVNTTLGFDVSSGIASLEQLIAAMTGYNSAVDQIAISSVRLNAANQAVQVSLKGVTAAGQNFSASMRNVAGALQPLSLSLGAVTTQVTTLTPALQQVGDVGEKSGQRIFLSWQNLLRIGLIYPVISKLVSAFSQGVQNALDLERQIAEIRTISQDAQLSTERWREGLIKLAVEFGRPVADVATAAYQAISNQVTKGAEAFDFLRDAMDFGRATVASTTDSVNLLSSVLNSYNLTQNQTREVAAELFKTIEIGRIQTKDLANSFGRVGPTANQLGVDLRELNSALAVLTIQGVKPNVALTFLEQLLIKLQKPTDEMAKALKRLGVPTGEQAIATFGLVGTLEKLGEAVAKGDSELGKLLPTVRGYQAFVSLAANGTDKLREAVEKNTNAQESYNKAIKIGAENLDTQYKKALESIKAEFLAVGRTISELVIFTVDLGKASLDLFDTLSGGSRVATRNIEENTINRVRVAVDAAQAEQRIFIDGLTGQAQSFNKFVAAIQGKLGQISSFHRVANDQIIERIAQAAQASAEFVERTFAKLDAAGKANLSEVQKIDGFIRDLESKSDQLRFAGQIKAIEQQKKFAEETFKQRRLLLIKELSAEADTNQEITQIRLGALSKEQKEFFARLDEKQQALRFAASQEDRETFARRRLETPKEEVNLLINRIETLEGVAKTLLSKGIPDEAKRTFDEINKLLEDLVSKTNQAAAPPRIDKTKFITQEVDTIAQQVERVKQFREGVLKFEADSLNFYKRPAEQALQAAVLTETLQEKVERLLKARQDETKTINAQSETYIELTKSVNKSFGEVEKFLTQAGAVRGEGFEDIENLLSAFKSARTDQDFEDIAKQIDAFQQKLEPTAKFMRGFFETLLSPPVAEPALNQLFSRILTPLQLAKESITELRGLVPEQQTALQKLIEMQQQATQIEVDLQDIPPQIIATVQATTRLATSMSEQINIVTEAVNQLADALQDAVNRINEINQMSVQPATVEEKSRGGFVPSFFARGGFVPHGTDTIPAMLTAGEFVVNRDSTRAFLPLLRQINQTRGTKSLASGGVVTTVGDINISVEGGKPASQTVKQIGKELRRQIKRGTIRLN
jgi:TP901 family phage tail tape measure protein